MKTISSDLILATAFSADKTSGSFPPFGADGSRKMAPLLTRDVAKLRAAPRDQKWRRMNATTPHFDATNAEYRE